MGNLRVTGGMGGVSFSGINHIASEDSVDSIDHSEEEEKGASETQEVEPESHLNQTLKKENRRFWELV